jgi:hypothetical protein
VPRICQYDHIRQTGADGDVGDETLDHASIHALSGMKGETITNLLDLLSTIVWGFNYALKFKHSSPSESIGSSMS